MIRAFHYYLFKFYLKHCLLIIVISIIAISAASGADKDSNKTSGINSFSVPDSILTVEQAEKLWGTINFTELQNEITNALNLSIMDATLFWEYLAPQIYQDQLKFLNGGYKSISIAGFRAYIASLKKAYIQQYAVFLPNKTAFAEELARQSALNRVELVNGPCVNMGFENGTMNGWTTYKARACSTSTQTPCNVFQGASPRINIKTAGYDPLVPKLSVVPPGASYSLMLEDYLNGANASEVSQTFLVTASNNVLTYKYATVLEDPGHPRSESPYFKVRLSTASGEDIPCGDYTAIAYPPILNFDSLPYDPNPFFNSDPVDEGLTNIDIYYRDWTTVSIPLNKYVGQNVTVTFAASDCSLGGHRGYAYIWAECSSIIPFSNNYICYNETLSYTASPGFAAYQWNGTGIVGSSSTETVKVNQPGVYNLILIPYADNPCPDTVSFNVLQHCNYKPNKDTLCETVPGSGKTYGVDLNSYIAQAVASNPVGKVQGWYSGPPADSVKIAMPANVTIKNGSKYFAVISYPTIGGDTAELDFDVNPKPTVNLPTELTYCADTLNYVILNAGGAGNRYYWLPTKDTSQAITVNSSGTYTVVVTNKYNCTSQAQAQVREVCPPRLFVSSAFSPNGDSNNDIYDVYTAHVGTFHMLIFNRWGEIIFESHDKNYFWNGIYRNLPMPVGVYPWVINYEGDSDEYKGPYKLDGSVTVVR